MLKDLFHQSHPKYPNEVIDILRLIRSENIGPKTFYSAIKLFGDARTAIDNIADFSLKGGRAKPIRICSVEDGEKELALLNKYDAGVITYLDPKYSALLKEIPDPPPLLTYKGNIELLSDAKIVAIVGARNASINGRSFCTNIVKELVDNGCTIVSGLARGIDTAAHSVNANKTIAVLAGGIDHIYPPENTNLYNKIADGGLIIAELPIGTKPLGQHFPQRNRLISGLSLGTVVIEASLKSGSLITARTALEQNREVFAVPGFPLDPRCQGTNKLLKQGAYLVENADDILKNLPNYDSTITKLSDNSQQDFLALNSNFNDKNYMEAVTDNMRRTVIESLSSTPISVDDLIAQSKLSFKIVHIIILELELAGRVVRYPGNKYGLIFT